MDLFRRKNYRENLRLMLYIAHDLYYVDYYIMCDDFRDTILNGGVKCIVYLVNFSSIFILTIHYLLI